jgi:hypothetical protein
MASNKNQHFVPKVYLRRFSSDPDEASVNLFNLARRRSIPQAPFSAFWRVDVEPLSALDMRSSGQRWSIRSLNNGQT